MNSSFSRRVETDIQYLNVLYLRKCLMTGGTGQLFKLEGRLNSTVCGGATKRHRALQSTHRENDLPPAPPNGPSQEISLSA
jgi:hypothetical protein